MPLFYILVPFAVLPLCAMRDASSFKIPNRYVAVLLAAWLPAAFLAGMDIQAIGLSAALGAVALLAGFALFAARLLGAGDAKLIAASALWVGPSGLAAFVFATALFGGILAFALLKMRKASLPAFALRYGWLVELHGRERVMPYGVAIAGGAMFALAGLVTTTA